MPESGDLSPELKDLCQCASQEQDPTKLRELAELINALLDQRFGDPPAMAERKKKGAA